MWCARVSWRAIRPWARSAPTSAPIATARTRSPTTSPACAALYPLVDYVAINVSSPNTPGLRDLQQRARLDELLGALLETRQSLAADRPAKPLLVKIAPDLDPDDEVAIAEVVTSRGIDGLIVSNTTIARPPVVAGRHAARRVA